MKILMNSYRLFALIFTIAAMAVLAATGARAIDIGVMTWTPRADWINIKTDPRVSPHAVGNGTTDDTAAIQSALNILNNNNQNLQDRTVYFPAGTYKISSTLKTTVSGYNIIGNGLNTIIKWYGSSGGAMFWPDGSDSVHYLGLVWDGNNLAGCAYEEYSDLYGGGSTYMTGIRHENESFRNFTVNGTYPAPDPNHIYPSGFPPSAIIAGFDNTINASPVGEVTVLNCCFNNAGYALYCPVEIFNNFMWVIDGCEFDNNIVGFSGTDNAGGGADWAIINTHFSHSSVADIGICYGMRGQRITSVGSNQFVDALAPGQAYRDCWVDSWTNTSGAMEFFSSGQISVVDCTFTNPPAGALPPISLPTQTADYQTILLSNNTSPNFPGTNILHQWGAAPSHALVDWVPAGSMGGNITSASKTFLNSATIADSTHILDVTKSPYNAVPGFNGTTFTMDSTSAIQAAITAAATANNGSIVYIPGGFYGISSTLNLPAGKYTVEGEGWATQVCWVGGSNGTMMTVTNPTTLTVRHIQLSAAYNPSGSGQNTNYPVSDPTTVTSLKETSTSGTSTVTYDDVISTACSFGNLGAVGNNAYSPGLVLSSLPATATVYIPVLNSPLTVSDSGQAHIFSRMAYMNGLVNVSGATNPKTGFLGLGIAEGGAPDGGQSMNNGYYNFTVNDNQNLLVGPYYSEQGGNDVQLLRGAGTTPGHVAIEGFLSAPTPISTTVNINNFAGRFFYGSTYLTGGNGSSNVAIDQTGSNPIDLMLVSDYFDPSPLTTLDTGANLIAALNEDNGGFLSDSPNPLTPANYNSIAAAEDDFRQLGALNLQVEYGIVNPSGLVAYWKLDEAATPSADSSMSGINGTWEHTPTFSTSTPTMIPYVDAGSIALNGTNQYISMGNPAALPTGTAARTICGWAKSTTTATGLRMIASFGTATTGEAMYVGLNGTSLVAGAYNSDLTVTNFWDTNWHFIALTYDGTTANLYADGVLKASAAESWSLVRHACEIGAFVNATDFWKGNVDDVRVYNYALSAAQVAALASQQTQLITNTSAETDTANPSPTTMIGYNPAYWTVGNSITAGGGARNYTVVNTASPFQPGYQGFLWVDSTGTNTGSTITVSQYFGASPATEPAIETFDFRVNSASISPDLWIGTSSGGGGPGIHITYGRLSANVGGGDTYLGNFPLDTWCRARVVMGAPSAGHSNATLYITPYGGTTVSYTIDGINSVGSTGFNGVNFWSGTAPGAAQSINLDNFGIVTNATLTLP